MPFPSSGSSGCRGRERRHWSPVRNIPTAEENGAKSGGHISAPQISRMGIRNARTCNFSTAGGRCGCLPEHWLAGTGTVTVQINLSSCFQRRLDSDRRKTFSPLVEGRRRPPARAKHDINLIPFPNRSHRHPYRAPQPCTAPTLLPVWSLLFNPQVPLSGIGQLCKPNLGASMRWRVGAWLESPVTGDARLTSLSLRISGAYRWRFQPRPRHVSPTGLHPLLGGSCRHRGQVPSRCASQRIRQSG